MEFKKIKIMDLIPTSYNPRKKLKSGDKEYEKIKSSIQEFGYVESVIGYNVKLYIIFIPLFLVVDWMKKMNGEIPVENFFSHMV